MAGIGLYFLGGPPFLKAFQTSSNTRPPLAPGILGLILVILVFANAFFSITASITEPDWYISRNQIDTLGKFRDQIPNNASVIIIGNTALAEWAPVILEREVLNIEFGLEWQPDELKMIQAINASIEKDDFEGMIYALETYTGEHQVYLVSTLNDLDRFQESLPQNLTLHLIASTRVFVSSNSRQAYLSLLVPIDTTSVVMRPEVSISVSTGHSRSSNANSAVCQASSNDVSTITYHVSSKTIVYPLSVISVSGFDVRAHDVRSNIETSVRITRVILISSPANGRIIARVRNPLGSGNGY